MLRYLILLFLLTGCVAEVPRYYEDCDINGKSLKETQIQFEEWFNMTKTQADWIWSNRNYQAMLQDLHNQGVCK